MNNGVTPFSDTNHLLADLWPVLVKIYNPQSKVTDHPMRAQRETQARIAAKSAKVLHLKTKLEKNKKTYGLG